MPALGFFIILLEIIRSHKVFLRVMCVCVCWSEFEWLYSYTSTSYPHGFAGIACRYFHSHTMSYLPLLIAAVDSGHFRLSDPLGLGGGQLLEKRR